MPVDDLRRLYAATTPPEASVHSLLHGMRKGRSFERPFSRAERLTLALISDPPHSHLTLTSANLDRTQLTRSWRLLRQRLQRERRIPDKLVYFGVPARTVDMEGYHLHVLVWRDYLHLGTVIGHAKAVGFGSNVYIRKIGSSLYDKLLVTSYVLSQGEAVFGTDKHHANASREVNKRSYLRPHRRTLERRAPKLLHALDGALSQAVSDQELAKRCPFFSSSDTPSSNKLRKANVKTGSEGVHG